MFWLLTLCGWLHTCPSEMISGFTAEVRGIRGKPPAALCWSLLLLPESTLPSSDVGTSPQTCLSPAYMILCLLLTHQVPCNEAHTCHTHVAWLCSKDLSAALPQCIRRIQNHEEGTGAAGKSVLLSLTVAWALPCTHRPAPTSVFTLPASPSVHQRCLRSAQHHTQVKQAPSLPSGHLQALSQMRWSEQRKRPAPHKHAHP